MALLHLLTAVATSAHLSPPCSSCIGPRFNWDTIPTFIHLADQCPGKDHCLSGGLSASDLAIIVGHNFSIVTFEKWQGDQISPPIMEEVAWVNAATQVKQADPHMFVLVWLDSFRICEFHSPGNITQDRCALTPPVSLSLSLSLSLLLQTPQTRRSIQI